ncbi:DNA replication/repair protein RecF [Olivibacter sitiensis]|uniref:DNA replication/repair protein RecF n=1 Tax=Olivibacter sitiensis TaxID=376470 RepID=UPI00040762BE|nr:DNA replication/repair protein RecF [Olivibacter sitiensis]
MWLQTLSLLHFKNYDEANLSFLPGVNAFTGANGAGKTNLLDAIHYLSLCKSYFNPVDSQQIKKGADFFMVQGTFEKDGLQDVIACSLKKNQKKQFKRNKKDYQRLADHIGLYPLVMVTPNDSVIITEGSEERRRFVDNVISQTDSRYLDDLITYNKYLQNRNSLLKQQVRDERLVRVYDELLAGVGNKIFAKRRAFMEVFVPMFDKHYHFISDGIENVQLSYESQLLDLPFDQLLQEAWPKDVAMERTTVGVHKDDLSFLIEGMSMKKFGSQGQQKSFLIALKLAQYSFLQQSKGYKPLLLLDDIFDKLDDMRTRKLMQMVSNDDFGQIFLTDTSAKRVENTFDGIDTEVRIFDVNKGQVTQLSQHEKNER